MLANQHRLIMIFCACSVRGLFHQNLEMRSIELVGCHLLKQCLITKGRSGEHQKLLDFLTLTSLQTHLLRILWITCSIPMRNEKKFLFTEAVKPKVSSLQLTHPPTHIYQCFTFFLSFFALFFKTFNLTQIIFYIKPDLRVILDRMKPDGLIYAGSL